MSQEQATTGAEARSRWVSAWDDLLAFANAGTWHIDGAIDHWCTSPACCNNFSFDASLARARSVVLRTILAHKPGSLILKKWTKLGPAIDWFVRARWFSNLVGVLWDSAFSQYARDGLAEPTSDLLLGELNWRKVRGSRVRVGGSFLQSDQYRVDVVALAVAIEPCRFLTYFFLAACREVRAPSSLPSLCVLAAPARSPIVVALQYLSALLAGRSSRLVLLFAGAGCDDLESWCQRRQRDAKLLRQLVLVVSGWVYYRHHRLALSFPFRLAALGIPDMPAAERDAIADAFYDRVGCCHCWGMAIHVQDR